MPSVIDPETKLHLVICDLCGCTLNLGIKASGHYGAILTGSGSQPRSKCYYGLLCSKKLVLLLYAGLGLGNCTRRKSKDGHLYPTKPSPPLA
jgi:hypothetical protein